MDVNIHSSAKCHGIAECKLLRVAPPSRDGLGMPSSVSVVRCYLVSQDEHWLVCSWQGDVNYRKLNGA